MTPRGDKAASAHRKVDTASTNLDNEIYRLLRCGHMLGNLLREILDDSFLRESCPFPLTRVQFCLLKLITVNANLQTGKVARYLGVTAAAITKNVDKLEDLGLVRRNTCDKDRRAIRLSATRSGRRLVRDFESLKAARVLPAMEKLDPNTVDQVCDLIEGVCVELYGDGGESGGICLRCAGYYDPQCPLHIAQGECALHPRSDPITESNPREMA